MTSQQVYDFRALMDLRFRNLMRVAKANDATYPDLAATQRDRARCYEAVLASFDATLAAGLSVDVGR